MAVRAIASAKMIPRYGGQQVSDVRGWEPTSGMSIELQISSDSDREGVGLPVPRSLLFNTVLALL